ncbi:MAG: hypothetical protein O6948_08630 [Deltaproteobacteria bacterium]|nr:hypothetical protein [Deltaproteobacteria bacterium]
MASSSLAGLKSLTWPYSRHTVLIELNGKGVIRPSGRKGGHWGERLEKIITGREIAKVVKIR